MDLLESIGDGYNEGRIIDFFESQPKTFNWELYLLV